MERKARVHLRSVVLVLLAWALVLPDETARANVVGSDLQNFNSTTDGLDFVTVQSSKTLDPGIMNFGLMVNHAVNSLPYFEDRETQTRTRSNDTVTTAEFNFGIGVWRRLALGIAFPYLLRQSIDETAPSHGEYERPGNTSIRWNAKYRLWYSDAAGLAVLLTSNLNRVRDNPYLGTNPGPIHSVEVAIDTAIDGIAVAMNLGYRWRSTTDKHPGFDIEPTPNQYIASVGASYLLSLVDTKVIAEIFGSRPAGPTKSDGAGRQASSAEVIAGLKHDLTTNLALHAGAGTELINGVSSPDWRIYGGLNWTIGPVFEIPPSSPAPKASPKAEEVVVLHNVYFQFGSDREVLMGAVKQLEMIAARIKEPPAAKRVVVEGHTDSVGLLSYNMDLSQRRAETIRKWLVVKGGVDPLKIIAIGFGPNRPIADNGNYQGRQLNRRVEVRIYR